MKNIDTILDGELIAFCPKAGVTYSGNVTVLETTAVKLGASVTISINSVGVEYKEGEICFFSLSLFLSLSASSITKEYLKPLTQISSTISPSLWQSTHKTMELF